MNYVAIPTLGRHIAVSMEGKRPMKTPPILAFLVKFELLFESQNTFVLLLETECKSKAKKYWIHFCARFRRVILMCNNNKLRFIPKLKVGFMLSSVTLKIEQSENSLITLWADETRRFEISLNRKMSVLRCMLISPAIFLAELPDDNVTDERPSCEQ